jgi:hypothetical protein
VFVEIAEKTQGSRVSVFPAGGIWHLAERRLPEKNCASKDQDLGVGGCDILRTQSRGENGNPGSIQEQASRSEIGRHYA